jgi:phosphoglycolate phosphatase (TIGR01487 family)
MVPPLAVDIDGTLSRADRSIDPRVFDALRAWDGPVVIATGKALPFPIALAQFVGIPERVIAENGGISVVDDELLVHGDRKAAEAVVDDYEAAGYDLGWGTLDLANRWRETEIAISRDSPLDPLVEIANDHGLEVVDTGFAYHVKSKAMSKGNALTGVARELGVDPSSFVAVGDSPNDVALFDVAGQSFAVANADDPAKGKADVVTDGSYASGFLEALSAIG